MRRGGPEWDEGRPERLYVITGGRSDPAEQTGLDLVTLIVASAAPQVGDAAGARLDSTPVHTPRSPWRRSPRICVCP